MSSEMHEILETIEAEAHSRPTPFEFELAYQARVAIDCLRFAIKHTQQFCARSDPLHEAGLQLLNALERLETVERRFQQRSRSAPLRASAPPRVQLRPEKVQEGDNVMDREIVLKFVRLLTRKQTMERLQLKAAHFSKLVNGKVRGCRGGRHRPPDLARPFTRFDLTAAVVRARSSEYDRG